MPNEKLIGKLVKIMGELGRVEKRGHNAHFNYDYVMEADLIDAVRGKLAANGILMMPNIVKTEWMTTEKGAKICSMSVQFTFTDGAENITFCVEGCGVDNPGDKAPYKAFTGAVKYALMKLFLIPTGDDPERDESHGEPDKSVKSGSVSGSVRGAQNAPAPATTRSAKDYIVSFGKNKGSEISKLSEADLTWWTEACQKAVDKNDAQWHEANVRKLLACKAEWEHRQPWRSVWSQALELATKSGIGEAALIDVVKEATGKTSAKELVATDYPKIKEAFDVAEKEIRESQ